MDKYITRAELLEMSSKSRLKFMSWLFIAVIAANVLMAIYWAVDSEIKTAQSAQYAAAQKIASLEYEVALLKSSLDSCRDEARRK